MAKRHPLYAEKRANILQASGTVMSRKGYAATRIEDIADELGVTKGDIYYYFPSKSHVLWALYDLAYDKVLSAQKEADAAKADDPIVNLRRAIHAHVKVTCENAVMFRAVWATVFDEITKLPHDSKIKVMRARRAYEEMFVTKIEDIPPEKRTNSLPPRLAVNWLLNSINSIPVWYRNTEPSTEDRNIEYLTQCALSSVVRDSNL